MPLGTKKIEELAVSEINRIILEESIFLEGDIPVNDKGISFDGKIVVFRSEKKIKSDFLGEVLVQVKGTTQLKLNGKKEISYSVEIADLRNYYSNGQGIVFFVVVIDDEVPKNKQAYFSMLAPLNLKSILKNIKSNQKSKALKFQMLNDGDLDSICANLIKSVDSQPKVLMEERSLSEMSSFHITLPLVPSQRKNFFNEAFFSNEAYLYTTENGINFPVSTIKFEEISMPLTTNFNLNDEGVEISYTMDYSPKTIIIEVERNLKFIIDKQNSKCRLDLVRPRTQSSYKKCLKLLMFICQESRMPFKGFSKVTGFNFDFLSDLIQQANDIFNYFHQAGIKGNFNLDLTEREYHQLVDLVEILFEKKEGILLEEIKKRQLFDLKVSDNYSLVYFYDVESDKMINIFTISALDQIKVRSVYQNNDGYEVQDKVSLFSNFTAEFMSRQMNFDLDVLEMSFSENCHEIKSRETVRIILDYLLFFDKAKDKRFLNLAYNLSDRYLKEMNGVPDETEDFLTAKLNFLQAKLRKSGLSETEKDELEEILDSSTSKPFKFGCEILLKNGRRAKRIFESLSDEEKNELTPTPIYNLYLEIQEK